MYIIINNEHVIYDIRLNNLSCLHCIIYINVNLHNWTTRCQVRRSLTIWNAALCEAVWPSMSFCPITLCTINLLFRSLLLFELFIAIITVLFSHYDDYFNWSTYCSTDFDSLYMPIPLYMCVCSVYEVLSIMFYGKWQRNRKRCFINRLACDTITCTIMVRNISYIKISFHGESLSGQFTGWRGY